MTRYLALKAYQDFYINRYSMSPFELELAERHLYICRIVLCCLDGRIHQLPTALSVRNEL
jgi:hypothetical protein